MARATYPLLAAAFTVGFSPLVQAASDQDVEKLKERLSSVEKQLKQAEGDEAPWDSYVDEVGGRIMYDETFRMDSDDRLANVAGGGGELEEGSEFRRLRMYMEGSVAPIIDYKIQLGFAGGSVDAKDVYIKAHDLGPLPDIKIGHFKEPISMQGLTSSKYITLMSRSMLTDFFSTSRTAGAQISDSFANERLNYTLGAFKADFDDETKETEDRGQDYNISARLTSPILYAQDGNRVVHLGVAFQRRNTDSVGIGLEPEVHKTDDFMAGNVDTDDANVWVAEAAGVYGPAYLQGEYAQMDLDTPDGTDPTLDGYYVQTGFLLTGETRPYDKGDGDFGRIKPQNPVSGWGEGTGAWGVSARYSTMDLTEAADAASFSGSFGGAPAQQSVAETSVTTVGLNWYPTAHSKWMLNYVNANQDDLGDAQYVTSRFQVDF